MITLSDLGSIASLAGVALGLPALLFAILQLKGLKGETRAAKEASEATRRAVGRDLAIADLSRTFEHVEAAKQALRERDWSRSLSYFPGIRRALISIRYRGPRIDQHQASQILSAVEFLEHVEHSIDVNSAGMADEAIHDFIRGLIDLQSTIAEMESNIHQSDGETS